MTKAHRQKPREFFFASITYGQRSDMGRCRNARDESELVYYWMQCGNNGAARGRVVARIWGGEAKELTFYAYLANYANSGSDCKHRCRDTGAIQGPG